MRYNAKKVWVKDLQKHLGRIVGKQKEETNAFGNKNSLKWDQKEVIKKY